MKIAIIGTHSTGKTTLIKQLAASFTERGDSVLLVPEIARLCPFPINEDVTPEAQNWIVENQIAYENNLPHTSRQLVLCDRTVLDGFTYLYRSYVRHKIADQAAVWEQKAVAHMPTYDFVFKTQKLDLPSVADGTRSTDEAFREEIDTLMTGFLAKHNIPYFSLPASLDYEVHVAFILSKVLPSEQYQRLQAAIHGSRSTHSLPLETPS